MSKSMRQYNGDSVGWIKIPGTKVNNPLVQCEDNDFYLSIGFNHQPYRAGTVFMDYRNLFGFGQENWSDNILLYGHNMANNEMFGSLRRYRQDLTYYQNNQFIELDSNYEHATYVICALPITYGGADADWRYWDMEEFKDEEEFNTYMKYARDQSVANITNVDVKYGDKLLTLSTCYSDEDNSRFLVIARKLRDEGIKKWNGTTDWTAITVYGILKNEKYAGDAVLQKTYTVDCILHKQVKNNGEKDKYIVYDCHPAIIGRDTYNRV
ncbi:MAG: sortase, partial [Oscillospiraceae bacterium]|nr:sortase [Oscillospiraceae bacterium]